MFGSIIFAVFLLAYSEAATLKLGPQSLPGRAEHILPGDIPYQLLVRRNQEFICGGSILNANTGVTAAHCVSDQVGPYSVVAGEHNHLLVEENAQIVNVIRVIKHPSYSQGTLVNDIAIIQFENPLTFNHFVQPIAIPPPLFDAEGDAVVSGWGTAGGPISPVLRKATVSIISDDECRAAFGSNQIAESMICAEVPEEIQRECAGDYGGPLTALVGNQRILIGLVSWGHEPVRHIVGFPGVYTEVSRFTDFIQSNLLI